MTARTAAQLAADAELASLALYAEDAFAMARQDAPGTAIAAVQPDPRLFPDYRVLGTLTAVDAVFGPAGIKLADARQFYGWALERNGEVIVAIRGTGDAVEWDIDANFLPVSVPGVPGEVESGFWSVFESMQLDGGPLTKLTGPVTVVGHSLGSAVATYVCLALAQAGLKVRGRFIASPRPGDGEFSRAFGAVVPDHVMYRNTDDFVPRVPFGFGYSAVPHVVDLIADKCGVRITGGLAAQHHVLSYVAMMDRATYEAFDPLPVDRKFMECVAFLPR